MNRTLCAVAMATACSLLPLSAAAQTTPDATACSPRGYTIGFFNGVWTTPAKAQIAKNYLKALYGTTATSGEPIEYEVYYNYTAGLEDLVETFNQRMMEQDLILQNRYELSSRLYQVMAVGSMR